MVAQGTLGDRQGTFGQVRLLKNGSSGTKKERVTNTELATLIFVWKFTY